MAELIDGKQLAKTINARTQQAVTQLKAQGISPKLIVIIVGDDQASQIYVRNKHRKAKQLGIISETRQLPEETSQAELLEIIDQYNHDDTVHGLMVQSPLPPQIMKTRSSCHFAS